MRNLLLLLAIDVASFALAADSPDFALGKPTAELPKHVVSPAEQITVFADYEHSEANGVPVYIVNRTAKPIPLESQDGDFYLKLEYERAPTVWARAQSHAYSWCGNSYHTSNLEPGRFFVVQGYRPATGKKMKVRYRFYGQETPAASNVGEGLVEQADVERAANDKMTVLTGDFDFVRKIALGENNETAPRRHDALVRLYRGKFDARQVEPVLKVVAKDNNEFLARSATRLLAMLKEREKPTQ